MIRNNGEGKTGLSPNSDNYRGAQPTSPEQTQISQQANMRPHFNLVAEGSVYNITEGGEGRAASK